eukprot:m.114644 g.114644  ORF g.114644 m.114644 type:complete len:579 (-) comp9281_c5_seq1:1635-3371(-)
MSVGDEASLLLEEQLKNVEQFGESVFEECDLDKNGWLSRTEMKKYMKAHAAVKKKILSLSHYHWKDLFDAIDVNGDRKMEKDEWIDFLKRHFHKCDEERTREIESVSTGLESIFKDDTTSLTKTEFESILSKHESLKEKIMQRSDGNLQALFGDNEFVTSKEVLEFLEQQKQQDFDFSPETIASLEEDVVNGEEEGEEEGEEVCDDDASTKSGGEGDDKKSNSNINLNQESHASSPSAMQDEEDVFMFGKGLKERKGGVDGEKVRTTRWSDNEDEGKDEELLEEEFSSEEEEDQQQRQDKEEHMHESGGHNEDTAQVLEPEEDACETKTEGDTVNLQKAFANIARPIDETEIYLYQRPKVSGLVSVCPISIAIQLFCKVHKIKVNVIDTANTAISKKDTLPMLCVGSSTVHEDVQDILYFLSNKAFGDECMTEARLELMSVILPVARKLMELEFSNLDGMLYKSSYGIYPWPLNKLLFLVHRWNNSTSIPKHSFHDGIDVSDAFTAMAAKLIANQPNFHVAATFTMADALLFGVLSVAEKHLSSPVYMQDSADEQALKNVFSTYPILLDFKSKWQNVL